jgi:exodeoxyribonuclease VII large subunit
VPLISAVGHEIDFTLCDLAADVRAETPSAAAELISSNHVAIVERIARARTGLEDVLERAVDEGRERLAHARSRLRLLSPAAVVEQSHLRLDDLRNRLGSALRASTQLRGEVLRTARARLAAASPEKRVQHESHRLLALWKRLESASPQSVLKRGYAIVCDESGRPVARAQSIKPGAPLVTEFHDGKVRVRAE